MVILRDLNKMERRDIPREKRRHQPHREATPSVGRAEVDLVLGVWVNFQS